MGRTAPHAGRDTRRHVGLGELHVRVLDDGLFARLAESLGQLARQLPQSEIGRWAAAPMIHQQNPAGHEPLLSTEWAVPSPGWRPFARTEMSRPAPQIAPFGFVRGCDGCTVPAM